MSVYIALLRGINVSGQNKILMSELKNCFVKLGFIGVETYIQSGNVIFKTDSKQPIVSIKTQIEAAILAQLGFSVKVLVLSYSELLAISENNPFLALGIEQAASFHFSFLSENPTATPQQALTGDFNPDQWAIGEKVLYIFCPNGYGKTKLNNNFIEKRLKTTATTRNYNTITKLLELCQGIK